MIATLLVAAIALFAATCVGAALQPSCGLGGSTEC
jgi:hypothetical protein